MQSKEMSSYEIWSLILTGIYDLLTFLLLSITVYLAVIQKRMPNIAFYYQRIQNDTKSLDGRPRKIDFILENRGVELKNVQITSQPDYLGWTNFGDNDSKIKAKSTSEYFAKPFASLGENEKKSLFWCNAETNKEILEKPFKITINFDNPIFILPKRCKREFNFDFTTKGIIHGVNIKYDNHNVAVEAARIRENLEKIEKHLEKVIVEISEDNSEE